MTVDPDRTAALAALLADPAVDRTVARARDTYARRRTALADALTANGVAVRGADDGLSLWIPVRDERAALVTLAAAGIAVAPGSRYHHGPHRPHIRVATGRRIDPLDEVAELIALAATDTGGTD